MHCHAVIREPAALRQRFSVAPSSADPTAGDRLEVLFATYGDPRDPAKVVECTEACRGRVREYGTRDRLVLRSKENLNTLFLQGAPDPNPGHNKQVSYHHQACDLQTESVAYVKYSILL